jgi:hypothetical protein
MDKLCNMSTPLLDGQITLQCYVHVHPTGWTKGVTKNPTSGVVFEPPPPLEWGFRVRFTEVQNPPTLEGDVAKYPHWAGLMRYCECCWCGWWWCGGMKCDE